MIRACTGVDIKTKRIYFTKDWKPTTHLWLAKIGYQLNIYVLLLEKWLDEGKQIEKIIKLKSNAHFPSPTKSKWNKKNTKLWTSAVTKVNTIGPPTNRHIGIVNY